jgi:hypothetical protein
MSGEGRLICSLAVAPCCSSGMMCRGQTLAPVPCSKGNFCPTGSAAGKRCDSGSYTNSTSLYHPSQCDPCPVGHSCEQGTITPRACEQGSFSSSERSAECIDCPAGRYVTTSGATACKLCGLGSWCRDGSSTPQRCPAGTWSGTPGLSSESECQDSRPGFYSLPGSTAPTVCPAGTYGDRWKLTQDRCSGTCDPGYYCEAGSSSKKHRACPAGSYSRIAATGPDWCISCGFGTFAATEGSSQCRDCPAGSAQSRAAMSSCEPCASGLYQPLPGSSECRPCETRQSSVPGASTCSVCAKSYFRRDADTSATLCMACSQYLAAGVECPWKTTIATLVLRPGYWRHSTAVPNALECKHADSSRTPCMGGADAGLDGDGYCRPGLRGPRCELCVDDNAYFDDADARCHSCGDVGARSALAAAFVLGMWRRLRDSSQEAVAPASPQCDPGGTRLV